MEPTLMVSMSSMPPARRRRLLAACGHAHHIAQQPAAPMCLQQAHIATQTCLLDTAIGSMLKESLQQGTFDAVQQDPVATCMRVQCLLRKWVLLVHTWLLQVCI
jgi:hypothetical protein